MKTNLLNAVHEFIGRKDRSRNPDGHFDNGGRFYPSKTETCSCCAGIRPPSRSFPYSYMTHCRSAEHVAHLFKIDAKLFRKAIKLYSKGESLDDLLPETKQVFVTEVKSIGDFTTSCYSF